MFIIAQSFAKIKRKIAAITLLFYANYDRIVQSKFRRQLSWAVQIRQAQIHKEGFYESIYIYRQRF